MQQTVIGVFSSQQDAEKAVQALRDEGFSREISIVTREGQGGGGDRTSMRGGGAVNASSHEGGAGGPGIAGDTRGGHDDTVSDGIATGAAWGGLGGLALGAGALVVPGIGPLLAAGPIAAALTGAAAGGLAGGLIDWGIPEERSREYEEKVKQGNTLAIVSTSDSKTSKASNILREHGARDVESHEASK